MHLENTFYEFYSVKSVRTSFQGVRIEINKRFTEAKIVLNFITSIIVYWVTTAI
jgi:16S rRNA C1402 N4-methylase RsmH